jgi:hypothetical protein
VQALVDAYASKNERGVSAPVMDMKSSISYVKTALWTQKDKNLGDKGVTDEADKALLNGDDRLRAAKEMSAKARKAWLPATQYLMLRTRALVAWMAAVDNREIDAMAPKLILRSQIDLQELINRNSYNFVTELLEWHAEQVEARLKNASPMEAKEMWLKPSNKDIEDFEKAWKKRQDDNRSQKEGAKQQQPPNKDGDKDDKDEPRGRGGRGGGGGKGKDSKGDGKGNRKPWEKRGSFGKNWQQRRDSRSRGDRRGQKDSRKRDRANRAESRGRSRGRGKKEKKVKRERSNSN